MNSLAELLKLPAAERAELAAALWDSLTPEQRDASLPPLTDEQADELDRRFAGHLAAPHTSIPWEEVKSRLAGSK